VRLNETGINRGQVFFVRNFPGLHGSVSKDRYVVVIHPADKLGEESLMAVAASRSSLSHYKVSLPNRADNPGCETGIPHRCSAVCCAYKFISKALLTDCRGFVSGAIVERLFNKTKEAHQDKKAGTFKTPSRD